MDFIGIEKIYILYINDSELFQIKKYLILNKINTHNVCFFKGCVGKNDFASITKEKKIDMIRKRTIFFNNYYKYLSNKAQKRNISIIKIFLQRFKVGELGCLQSHINIMKDAIKNKYKKIIVLEYDIFINKNWRNIILKFNNEIDTDNYKCISLGSTQYKLDKPYTNNSNLFYFNNYFSTFALYLHDMDCFFMHYITVLESFILPTDHCLDLLSSYYNNKGFAIFYPYIFICDISKSNTNNVSFKIEKEAIKRNWDLSKYYIIKIYNNSELLQKTIKTTTKITPKYSIIKYKKFSIYNNIIPNFE